MTAQLKRIGQKLLCLVSAALVIFSLAQFKEEEPESHSLKLTLKWYKAYEGQTWQAVKTGMLWSFSSLGAMLPRGALDSAISFHDSTLFELDLGKLGFSPDAEHALGIVCDHLKQTSDYQQNQFVDLSRFFLLTLHSPYNYYSIVGVEKNYQRFRKRYGLDQTTSFGLIRSSVSKGHRLIHISRDTNLFHFAFAAEEGDGSLMNGTFNTVNAEVFDIMENGQLRFAIYDKNGELTAVSDDAHSLAGKPSKCMWCHELYIQPLFSQNTAVPHMMSNEEFQQTVSNFQRRLDTYRKTLRSDIDFSRKQDHTYSELLYITFMEPPLFRLQQEFQNTEPLLNKIKKFESHTDQEFSFLGVLYQRNRIDSLFPYPKIRIPESVREKSMFEPDYFHD